MAAQKFRFVIEIEVERTNGKFASRDEISEELQGYLSDPGSITCGESGEYDVVSFDVQEEDKPDPVVQLARSNGVDPKKFRRGLKKLLAELKEPT